MKRIHHLMTLACVGIGALASGCTEEKKEAVRNVLETVEETASNVFDPQPSPFPGSPKHVGDPGYRCHLDDADQFARVHAAGQISDRVYDVWDLFPDRGDDVGDVYPTPQQMQAKLSTEWTYLDHFLGSYRSRGFAVLAAKDGVCYLAFKGTNDIGELKRDFESVQQADCKTRSGKGFGRCGKGFYTIMATMRGPDRPGVRGQIIERVKAWTSHPSCAGGFVVTGHSLGGALADLLIANYHAAEGAVLDSVSFAGPRTFEKSAAAKLHGIFGGRKLRLIRRGDLVPNFPTKSMDFEHFGRTLEVSEAITKKYGKGSKYMWNMGRTFRSKAGPYHPMKGYAELVDGACTSGGQFSTNKR